MQAELAAVAHDLITTVEPGFGHLTLRASCHGSACNYRVTAGSGQDLFPSMDTLREVGAEQQVVFEMRLDEDGTFEALATRDVIQSTRHLPPTYTILLKPHEQRPRLEVSTLAEVERAIGVSLPREMHDLYEGRAKIDEEIVLYSPDEILLTWQWYLSELERNPEDWEVPVVCAGPPGAVRGVQFHPLWIPFGSNDWGDVMCLDLAPGPAGRVGQVILAEGRGGPLTYLAGSIAGLTLPDSYPGTKGLEEHFDAADLGPAGVAALPETVQQATVREPGDLDFGLLAHLTSLRHLRVVRGGSVRLSALAHLPLERLEVSGYEIELPRCESLRALVIEGAFVELPELPNLRVLDASKAEVHVESLPEVDYLVLNAAQWQRCSQRPAAATLTGKPSLADALVWARELGVELPYEIVRGRVPSV